MFPQKSKDKKNKEIYVLTVLGSLSFGLLSSTDGHSRALPTLGLTAISKSGKFVAPERHDQNIIRY